MFFDMSACLTEDIEKAETDNVLIQYYNLKAGCYQEIHSSQGDILVVINAMADYADILTEYLRQSEEIIGFQRAFYEIHIERCQKIVRRFSEAVGYDRESAIEMCTKKKRYWDENFGDKGDIGEDALVLATKHKKEKEQNNEQNS